jgi:hypothetical protein
LGRFKEGEIHVDLRLGRSASSLAILPATMQITGMEWGPYGGRRADVNDFLNGTSGLDQPD